MDAIEFVNTLRNQDVSGYISTLYHCSTAKTSHLCFYSITDKLNRSQNDIYDIGGTYTDRQPDFWFYYTTSMCHGSNYLLNLFVLPRQPASFSLVLPKANKLMNKIKAVGEMKLVFPRGPQTALTFRTTQPDEHVYVKTFMFNLEDVNALENNTFLMPLKIKLHNKLQLDNDTVRTIKLRHDLSILITQKENTDFTLLSSSSKSYPVHKVLLAAHSPVLRSMIEKSQENSLTLDVTDEAMEVILEFLYTGTLSTLHKQDFVMLLGIAERLQFVQLFALVQQNLGEAIDGGNAIEVALIAKKHNLDKLTHKVFEYIKGNPVVLTSERWQGLKDVEFLKQLLKYLHPPSQNED